MKPRVYIDGKSGTTGLKIHDRLKGRDDLEILLIPEELRRDRETRKEYMNGSDLVFLCLPDDAAREAVTLIENPDTKVIDTSTAHRLSEGWVYGFPELSYDLREKIKGSKRVANPGCHATGFISIVRPLIDMGIIDRDTPLTSWSLTGYSGGGKKMIEEYEGEERNEELLSPRLYGLNGNHKHIPEMTAVSGLNLPPVFNPIVADYYEGMEVSLPLHRSFVNGFTASQVAEKLFQFYRNTDLISVNPEPVREGFLGSNSFAGKDSLEIYVTGNDDRITVVARFDNLGKGASGAAVENMNLLLGFNETEGLIL